MAKQKGSPNTVITGNSLEKMLAVLDLITLSEPTLTVEYIGQRLGSSKATAYRYVKALTNAGILAPAKGGTYSLGARIIQLDRQMRLGDPLLAAARSPMAALSKSVRENVILCGFYGEHVVCLHEEWAHPQLTTSFERGRPMPMFRGAVSKVILAHLPTYKQRNLMLHYASEIAEAGLGPDWAGFKTKMKAIRKDAYCHAAAEVDRGLTGTAVPLFGAAGEVCGSLCVIQPIKRFSKNELPSTVASLQKTAKAITHQF